METRAFSACLLLALMSPTHVAARGHERVIYVNARAHGADSGASWRDAYDSLQSALAVAAAGDSIWVAEGTYRPTDGRDRSASFALVDGVGILGGFAGMETSESDRNPRSRPTILSGNIGAPDSHADDSFHVVTADAMVGPSAVLDGFIIERGNATDAARLGGGIYLAGSPRISRSTLRDNRAVAGGAVYVDLGSPAFVNCTFNANFAEAGGAVYTRGGLVTFVNAEFVANTAAHGAAAYVEFGRFYLINATVTRNVAEKGGGALADEGGAVLIHNSIVWGNIPAGSPLAGLPPVAVVSDLEGGFPGAGNFDANPRFVDAEHGDFRLAAGSPAIDAGNNALVPTSVTTARGGGPRIAHGSQGRVLTDARVDLGAWEFEASDPSTPALGASSPAASDVDGDGIPDSVDCRPNDPSVWAVPSPARNLVLSGSSTTNLSWSAPLDPGGTNVLYDVIRSASASNFATATCIYANQVATGTSDAVAVIGGYYYLVRAKNVCGENLGMNSASIARTGAACTAGIGQLCGSDLACASGFCTDGVCCNARCAGVCESCNLAGQIGSCDSVSTGADPDNECAPDPPTSCGLNGQCSGARTCQLYPAGTTCTPANCANATQLALADTCNGVGGCVDGGLLNCSPYACNGAACRTTCTSNAQCAPGFGCKVSTGQCLASDGAACSANGDCLNSACCANICRNVTNDTANCGNCGLTCTNPNGTTSCAFGSCSPVCSAQWGSCDGNPVNGCETSLRTLTNCGACGLPCALPGASESCSTGTCQIGSCDFGFSNCDGGSGNGCEVNHAAVSGSCGAATFVGSAGGDTSCGGLPFCTSNTAWAGFASTTGRTSAWFRARVLENSSCTASIAHRIDLIVPAGVDYDLYVYRPCGTLVGFSANGVGLTESVTVSQSDSPVEDSFDYWVEVRFFTGESCTNWTITFFGHPC